MVKPSGISRRQLTRKLKSLPSFSHALRATEALLGHYGMPSTEARKMANEMIERHGQEMLPLLDKPWTRRPPKEMTLRKVEERALKAIESVSESDEGRSIVRRQEREVQQIFRGLGVDMDEQRLFGELETVQRLFEEHHWSEKDLRNTGLSIPELQNVVSQLEATNKEFLAPRHASILMALDDAERIRLLKHFADSRLSPGTYLDLVTRHNMPSELVAAAGHAQIKPDRIPSVHALVQEADVEPPEAINLVKAGVRDPDLIHTAREVARQLGTDPVELLLGPHRKSLAKMAHDGHLPSTIAYLLTRTDAKPQMKERRQPASGPAEKAHAKQKDIMEEIQHLSQRHGTEDLSTRDRKTIAALVEAHGERGLKPIHGILLHLIRQNANQAGGKEWNLGSVLSAFKESAGKPHSNQHPIVQNARKMQGKTIRKNDVNSLLQIAGRIKAGS